MSKPKVRMYDVEVCKQVGPIAATILNDITFWQEKSEANGKNFHDGRHWVYNSIKAWAKLFPEYSPKQIRTALGKLEDAGFIVSGEFNCEIYDKTKWYSAVEKNPQETSFAQNGKPFAQKGKTFAQKGKPIPEVLHNIDSSLRSESPPIVPHGTDEQFDEWYSGYPHKVGKAAAKKAFNGAIKKTDVQTLVASLDAYKRDKPPDRSWCNPATWLNQERWLDEPDNRPADENRRQTYGTATRESYQQRRQRESDEAINSAIEQLYGRQRGDDAEAGSVPADRERMASVSDNGGGKATIDITPRRIN